MIVRKAAVAGSFYPRYKPDLLRILNESFLNKDFGPGKEFSTLNQEQRTNFFLTEVARRNAVLDNTTTIHKNENDIDILYRDFLNYINGNKDLDIRILLKVRDSI